MIGQAIYVSATPAEFEIKNSVVGITDYIPHNRAKIGVDEPVPAALPAIVLFRIVNSRVPLRESIPPPLTAPLLLLTISFAVWGLTTAPFARRNSARNRPTSGAEAWTPPHGAPSLRQ